MTTDHDEIKRQRKLVKDQYGVLYDRVAALLFESDPVGLNFGGNTDEYELEAGTILPRLKEAGSAQDVERIVHEEFCRWFGEREAGPRENYRLIAEAVWTLWREFDRPSGI